VEQEIVLPFYVIQFQQVCMVDIEKHGEKNVGNTYLNNRYMMK